MHELSDTWKELLAASSKSPYPQGLGGNLDIYDTGEPQVAYAPPRSRDELVEEAPELIIGWASCETDEEVDCMGETLYEFANEWNERCAIDECERQMRKQIPPKIDVWFWITWMVAITFIALMGYALYRMVRGMP